MGRRFLERSEYDLGELGIDGEDLIFYHKVTPKGV